MFSTRHHSYPAIHQTIWGYTGVEVMSFTAHIHPNTSQGNEIFLYAVKWISGGVGMVLGGGVIVYHSCSAQKIDKSCLVPSKFISFCVFFMLILHLSVITSNYNMYLSLQPFFPKRGKRNAWGGWWHLWMGQVWVGIHGWGVLWIDSPIFNFKSYLIRLSYLISDHSGVWSYVWNYKVQGHTQYTCRTHGQCMHHCAVLRTHVFNIADWYLAVHHMTALWFPHVH